MGLLTRKELVDLREGKVSHEEAPRLPPLPVPDAVAVRMHHPETSPRYPLRDFTFLLDGKEIETTMGVATVTPAQADLLEAMHWRRGRTLPLGGY